MPAEQVESICSNLSTLFKNAIRVKLLKHEGLPKEYLFREALIFWTSDMLMGTKLLTYEQLRFVLEEFLGRLSNFGDTLERAWVTGSDARGKRLPMCKLGFLDRKLACIDGSPIFIDLNTGEHVPATDTWPLETVTYNLTTLFIKYNNAIKKVSSAAPGDKHGKT